MRALTHITSAMHTVTRYRKKIPLTAIIIICNLIILSAVQFANVTYYRSHQKRGINRRVNTNFSDRREILHLPGIPDQQAPDETCQKYPPKAIVFGVSKCETGALKMFLSAHPDIDNAPAKGATERAVSYFDLHFKDGLKWYIQQMPCSEPDRMIIDHTPQYFMKDYVPKRVYKFNSTVKLIVSLCEPITRTLSQYLQMKTNHPESFENHDVDSLLKDKTGTKIDEANTVVVASTYVNHLQNWLNSFQLDQIYIIDGSEFVVEPLRQLQGLEAFLGVNPYFNADSVYHNDTRGTYCVKDNQKLDGFRCGPAKKEEDKLELQESTLHLLKEHFHTYNEQLFEIINRRFSWTQAQ